MGIMLLFLPSVGLWLKTSKFHTRESKTLLVVGMVTHQNRPVVQVHLMKKVQVKRLLKKPKKVVEDFKMMLLLLLMLLLLMLLLLKKPHQLNQFKLSGRSISSFNQIQERVLLSHKTCSISLMIQLLFRLSLLLQPPSVLQLLLLLS